MMALEIKGIVLRDKNMKIVGPFKIMDGKEVIESGRKIEERLKRQCYIDDDCIILNVDYRYGIELDRCNTPTKLLHWTHHLLGKSWMDSTLISYFIETINSYYKFNIFENC